MENLKRLRYSVDLDPIFISQNILLILKNFNITSDKKKFNDPIKLSTLIYIVTNDEYFSVIEKVLTNMSLGKVDLEALISLKLKSKLVQPVLHRSLNLLINKNIIDIRYSKTENFIFLKEDLAQILNNSLYEKIDKRIQTFRRLYRNAATTSINAFGNRIFKEIGNE